MSFFENQARAKRISSVLMLFFALAVVLIIFSVYALVMTGLLLTQHSSMGEAPPQALPVFITITAITTAIVACGTLFKVVQLARGGGDAVAMQLGGVLIPADTTNAVQRKLLNVVEEMAIASGMPVPRVYMLKDQEGINAFAAGFSPDQAVIAVTEGALCQLTRDELQGVIGHEFSHILNGDMRLNLKLMGLLNGILVMALTGRLIMNLMGNTRGRSVRRSRDSSSYLVLVGVAFFVMGYIGVFFAKLIKSAVSRQREYLADASSVQFTRNPSGLLGALTKIAAQGSVIVHPQAESASHLFFASGVQLSFIQLLATHPPLSARIKRLEEEARTLGLPLHSAREDGDQIKAHQASAHNGAHSSFLTAGSIAVAPTRTAERVGTTTAENLAAASRLVHGVPLALQQLTKSALGAEVLVLLLLLDDDPAIQRTQCSYLNAHLDAFVRDEFRRHEALALQIRPAQRLLLIDLAYAQLKGITKAQFEEFRTHVQTLIMADNECTLFEYAVITTILRRLDREFESAALESPSLDDSQARPLAAELLKILAMAGTTDTGIAAQAFQSGCQYLQIADSGFQTEGVSVKALDEKLRLLSGATYKMKKQIIESAVATISHDGIVSLEESEIIRAIASALDCPLPPFPQELLHASDC